MTEEKNFEQAAETFDEMQEDYKYTAFISYRHIEPDATIAKNIHTMIETFKLPKEFREGHKGFRVFRDREELTTSSLSDSIQNALRSSQYLIVICSKRLRESEWCNIEVETFLRLHGADRIIPVLIEGEPEDSFPKALLSDGEDANLEDGTVDVGNKDILAAELRSPEAKRSDFIGFETLEKTNPKKLKELTDAALKELKTEKYRIMAAILGVSYGDLVQRDKARRQRTLLTLSGIVSAALLFFGIFMFNAYRNENIAKRQTMQDRSSFLLQEADTLQDSGDTYKAILVSNKALSDLDEDMENYEPLRQHHEEILNNALNRSAMGFERVISTKNRYTFLDINKSQKSFAAGVGNDSVGVWSLENGNELHRVTGHEQQVKLVEYAEDDSVLVTGGFDDRIILWDANTMEKITETITPGNVMYIKFQNESQYLEVIYDTIDEYVFQRYDAKTLEPIGNAMSMRNNIKRVVADDEGKFLWVIYNTYQEDASLIKYDLTTGQEIKIFEDPLMDPIDFDTPTLSMDEETEEGDTETLAETEAISETESIFSDPYKVPYKDAVKSSISDSFYVLGGLGLQKYDQKTDQVLFTSDAELYSVQSDLHLAEVGDYIYVGNGASLLKIDANTGKTVLDTMVSTDSIIDIVADVETNRVILLTQGGSIIVIEEDRIIEEIPGDQNSTPEYVYNVPGGEKALVLSLTDQTVKLLDFARASQVNYQDGQIIGVSRNQAYALIYDKAYYLMNAATGERMTELKNDALPTDYNYVFDTNNYIVSNDGKKLAGLDTLRDIDGNEISSQVFVMDIETQEVIYQIPAPMVSFYYGFSEDGTQVYMTTANDTVTMYDVATGNAKEVVIAKGILQGINIDATNTYLVANYSEGISTVFAIDDGSELGSVPGQTLDIESKEDGIHLTTEYNNVISRYVDFEKAGEDVTLSEKREEMGVQFDEQDRYLPEKELLLTIKSIDGLHYGYLLDVKTGALLQSYRLANRTYKPRALISPEGNGIWMDHMYQSSFDDHDNYISYRTIGFYPVNAYEELVNRSGEYVDGVVLQNEELQELNIGDEE